MSVSVRPECGLESVTKSTVAQAVANTAARHGKCSLFTGTGILVSIFRWSNFENTGARGHLTIPIICKSFYGFLMISDHDRGRVFYRQVIQNYRRHSIVVVLWAHTRSRATVLADLHVPLSALVHCVRSTPHLSL